MRAAPADGRRYPVRIRRIVVLPEPFGPSSPMTSPAATSRDTRSTASRGPYHLESWSATMTGGMAGSDHRTAGRPGRPTVRPTWTAWSCDLLEDLGSVRGPRLAGGAVPGGGGHEAPVLPSLEPPDVLARAPAAGRAVGERDIGQQVLCPALGGVDLVAPQADPAR